MDKYSLYLNEVKIGEVIRIGSDFPSAWGTIKYEQNIPDKVRDLIEAYKKSEHQVDQGKDEESFNPVEVVYEKYPELFERGTWYVVDDSGKKEGVLLKSLTEDEICLGAWFDDEFAESEKN